MYRFLTLCLFAIAGCTPSGPPQLGEPIPLSVPAAGSQVGPRFAAGPDQQLVMSWMRRNDAGASLRYASFGEDGFNDAVDVVTDARMFVNWADVPSVMPVSDDHWIAHWLSYSADRTYSYDVVVAQSFDGGQSWGEPLPAHTDGTPTEHGFVSMHPEADGVAVLWLDGRDTSEESTDNPLDTSMTLRAATITPDGQRLREQLVDDAVCDCCQTDVAVSTSGPIAVYRNRTAAEVRDIYITRYEDGRWSAGQALHADNWVIPGCPVNGPSITAVGDFVTVAWFSVQDNQPVVRALVSTDAGATFGEPVVIDAGRLSGFVGTAIIDDRTLAVSWVAKGENDTNAIRVRTVTTDGELGPMRTVGDTRQVRLFPQLARHEDHLVVAWTDDVGDETRIEAVRVPIVSGR